MKQILDNGLIAVSAVRKAKPFSGLLTASVDCQNVVFRVDGMRLCRY